MKICPSIASSNLLRIEEEIEFIDKYFNSIHLDIEDGNAVNSISFGFKLAKNICKKSTSSEKTMHLEVVNPVKFIKNIKECNIDLVFVQIDVLSEPLRIVKKFKDNGIVTGINISNFDLRRQELNELIESCECILVNTTHHDDPMQVCDMKMIEVAIALAEKGKKVWVDGGITWELYDKLSSTKIYSVVMGRAIFSNKHIAVQNYLKYQSE